MSDLLIPFAVDKEGKLLNAITAEKGRAFFCPECRSSVILRRGKIKVAHFAHKYNESCSEESVTHRIAKLLIKQSIEEWKSNESEAPVLLMECLQCRRRIRQSLPGDIDKANLEHWLPGNYRVDVALMAGDSVRVAVEVKVSHAVDEVKAENLSVPFMELAGRDVIDHPREWRPISSALNPFFCCDQCKEIAEAIIRENYYKRKTWTCWNCERAINVYMWPNAGFSIVAPYSGWSVFEPRSKPKPETVKLRYSKTVKREYWVNVCQFCDAVQGDWFLQDDPALLKAGPKPEEPEVFDPEPVSQESADSESLF
jgi:hypothetical protein